MCDAVAERRFCHSVRQGARCRFLVDAAIPASFFGPSPTGTVSPRRAPTNAALPTRRTQLAQIFMMPVKLFRSDDGYGVLQARSSMTAKSRPSPNTTRSTADRLIEPTLFLPEVSLASGRRQGKLRRGRPAGLGALLFSSVAGRALAPFALRGVRTGLREMRGKEKARKGGREGVPARLWKRVNWKNYGTA